jgi:hypothetical protein
MRLDRLRAGGGGARGEPHDADPGMAKPGTAERAHVNLLGRADSGGGGAPMQVSSSVSAAGGR